MTKMKSHLSLAMRQELRWTSSECPQEEGRYVSLYQDEKETKGM
jgi:hypothetical protein